MIKVGINGFGRVGRLALRICQLPQYKELIQVVALNSRSTTTSHAHLLQHDTMYGPFAGTISIEGDHLLVNGQKVHVFRESDPAMIPWEQAGVDLVLECTGKFRTKNEAAVHLRHGVKKVIISAPAKGCNMYVMGVNHKTYDAISEDVISMASCTTNCLAPIVALLDKEFGITKGFMTTVHAVTSGQRVLDNSHKDLRRARTCFQNMIPTTTGATFAVTKILPQLEGKMDGICIRVPMATVSIVDFVCETAKPITKEVVNQAFISAAGKYMGVSDQPLVSSDYVGNSHNAVVDLLSTQVIGDNFVKVLAWYDNEYGYASRLVDLVVYVGEKLD
jgi:glyceraldehyde 3-phosphate dehydrogenase